jgi:hypothetical protein
MHSTPAVLGTLIADEDGDVRGTLHLPPRLELGRHEIVASGKGADGTFRQDRVAVSVLARAPAWVQLALVGTGLLVVVSVVCAALWWRGSRGGAVRLDVMPRHVGRERATTRSDVVDE